MAFFGESAPTSTAPAAGAAPTDTVNVQQSSDVPIMLDLPPDPPRDLLALPVETKLSLLQHVSALHAHGIAHDVAFAVHRRNASGLGAEPQVFARVDAAMVASLRESVRRTPPEPPPSAATAVRSPPRHPPGGGGGAEGMQPRQRAPRGGMVWLQGSNLRVSVDLAAARWTSLDVCNGAPCLRAVEGRPSPLPFSFDRLFAEVWQLVHDQGEDTFYLSINPRPETLHDGPMMTPSRFVEDSSDPQQQRNDVVVMPEALRTTAIGRLLYDADILFKSRGLGFDIRRGGRRSRAIAHLVADETETWARAARRGSAERCRFYWSSGTVRMSSTESSIRFEGAPVVARAEPMRVQGNDLVPAPAASGCRSAQKVAQDLNQEVRRLVGHVPTRRRARVDPLIERLVRLAQMQVFTRWARDLGLAVTPAFEATARGALSQGAPPLPVPLTTSGVRNPTPSVAQLVHHGFNALIRVWLPPRHALMTGQEDRQELANWRSIANNATYLDFASRDLTFARRFTDRWDITLISDPHAYGEFAWFGEEGTRQRSARLLFQTESVEAHGGVMLGAAEDRPDLDRLDLRGPNGQPILLQLHDGLHVWRRRDNRVELEHLHLAGTRVSAAYATGGHVRLLVEPQEVAQENLTPSANYSIRFASSISHAWFQHFPLSDSTSRDPQGVLIGPCGATDADGGVAPVPDSACSQGLSRRELRDWFARDLLAQQSVRISQIYGARQWIVDVDVSDLRAALADSGAAPSLAHARAWLRLGFRDEALQELERLLREGPGALSVDRVLQRAIGLELLNELLPNFGTPARDVQESAWRLGLVAPLAGLASEGQHLANRLARSRQLLPLEPEATAFPEPPLALDPVTELVFRLALAGVREFVHSPGAAADRARVRALQALLEAPNAHTLAIPL